MGILRGPASPEGAAVHARADCYRAAPVRAALDLLVVSGKGGVGKTAVAAGLGLAAAAHGRHPVVVEVDPRESLHAVFGASPSGGEPVAVAPFGQSLRFLNLRPRAALDRFVEDKLRLGRWTGQILSSAAYGRFAEAAPGIPELAVLGQARRIVAGEIAELPGADLVILDAPATGHGLAMLEAPRRIADTVRQGPFGKLGDELASWVGDPSRVGVLLVATPEELPVQETLESIRRLEDGFGRPPLAVVINQVVPPDAADGAWPDAATEHRWLAWSEAREKERARLAAAWQGERVELPLLAEVGRTELLAAFRGPLEAWWGRS
jgi:anion-transporting  ArsA/GET3 family ATPase